MAGDSKTVVVVQPGCIRRYEGANCECPLIAVGRVAIPCNNLDMSVCCFKSVSLCLNLPPCIAAALPDNFTRSTSTRTRRTCSELREHLLKAARLEHTTVANRRSVTCSPASLDEGIHPFILRDSENSEMPGRKKATPKPTPTAYSRVTGKDWRQKLAFIRAANEQGCTTLTDTEALIEYIDKLETYLDKTMDDATAGTGGWRQYALGDKA